MQSKPRLLVLWGLLGWVVWQGDLADPRSKGARLSEARSVPRFFSSRGSLSQGRPPRGLQEAKGERFVPQAPKAPKAPKERHPKGSPFLQRSRAEGRVFGVFVGVTKYRESGHFPNLTLAVNDACRLAQTFEERGRISKDRMFLFLSGRPRCGSLTSQEPSLRALRRVLGDQLPKLTSPLDRVVFFFSGHGENHPERGFSIVFPETRKEALATTSLSHVELKRLFDGLPARQQVIFLDTCYSGWTMKKVLVLADPFESLGDQGRLLFAASAANQRAFEYPKAKMSLFSYVLHQALSGKADLDKDRVVDHLEVIRYVMTWVPRMAKQHLKQEQNPIQWGQIAGIMPLVWLP